MMGWIAITVLLLGLLWMRYKRHDGRSLWRKHLHLDAHQKQFQKLYATVDGFQLSRQGRLNHDSMEYVYGEIEFESFIALLSLCPIDQKSVFYDLGSGSGKAVIASLMVYDMARYCGIECLQPLYDASCWQAAILQTIEPYRSRIDRVTFIHGDFLKSNFSDASILFINATAFFGERWRTISKHLEQVASGTMVISTSKKVQSPQFQFEKETVAKMSWGLVKVYFQKKIGS